MNSYSLLAALLLLTVRPAHAQEIKIVRFKQQKLAAKAVGYAIAAVKDDRADTSDIGSVRASVFSKKTTRLNLPDGTAGGLFEFLRGNFTQDATGSLPVILHITRFEVAEQTGGLHAESEVAMTLAFFTGKNKMVEYTIKSSVSAGVDAFKYIEGQIRQNLDTVLRQFNKWYSINEKEVLAAVKGPLVLVKVVFAKKPPDNGMVLYSRREPLKLEDFQGKPDDYLPAAAATSSGIDLKYESENRYGQSRLTVTLSCFFDKNRSWCRSNSRNAETLRHEQIHFDITAVKTCELAAEISAWSFNSSDYTGEIDQLYTRKQADTEKMQDQYDGETKHGQLADAQQKWETRVKELLAGQSCYQP